MGYGLGVDLGTSVVSAAIAHGPRVEMVALGDRTVDMPAVVDTRDDGTIITGDAADRRALVDPHRAARALLRRLGDPGPVVLGGRPHAVVTLLAALLSDAVRRVADTQGGPPEHVVLTHPATWGPYRRDLFAEVARIGGVAHARLITTPEAAATHHAITHRLRAGATVVVYDLGGGMFEATVLRIRAAGVAILGTPEGIERLGGVDFDDAVLAHINYSSGGALSELDLSNPQTAVALARLRQDAILAKEALSIDTEATIPVFLPHRHFDVHLTRPEFEDMIRAQVESTIGALTRTLRSAGVEPHELDAVLLVGGSSRIPLVARMITEALHRPTLIDAHPKYAVALGAATLAASTAVATPSVAASSVAATASAPVTAPVAAAAGPEPAASDRPSPAQRRGLRRRPPSAPSPPPPPTAAPPPPPAAPLTPRSDAPSVAAVPRDDDVQFTLYRPARVGPLEWCPILLYTHRGTPFLDERSGRLVDPVRQVQDDAQRELPPERDYGRVSTDSDRPVPRGTELTLQPWLSEGFVDPPHQTLRWQGSMHRATFRICAPASPRGPRLTGGVRIYQGPLLVAETRFAIPVTRSAPTTAPSTTERVTRYRRIFASYSRRDLAVVEAVKDYNLMGDEYLIDLLALRPGEKWEPRLIELIEQADVFQLFWSHNAMASSHVRREWEHALSLDRPAFVCPVYWEDPRPTDPGRALPPPTLEELHWSRLPASRLPRVDTGPEVLGAPALTAAGPSAPEGGFGRFGVPTGTPPRTTSAAAAGPVTSAAPPPAAPPPEATSAGAILPGPAGSYGAEHRDRRASPASARDARHRRRLTAALVGVFVLLFVPIGYLTRPTGATVGPSAAPPLPGIAATSTPDAGGAGASGAAPGAPAGVLPASVSVPEVAGVIPAGRAPGFVAVAPDGRSAYVADRAANVVTVVDTAVAEVTARIPVTDGPPQYLAVSPDGARLYVSVDDGRAADEVAVLDTRSRAVVATIRVGHRPSALAVRPDGSQVYVADRDTGTVSVIDSRSNRLVTDIPVGAGPVGVTFSRDGTRAFVACSGSPSISVIDTVRRAAVAGIPVNRSSGALAIHPTQPLLAAVNPDDNTVSVLDTTADRTIATVAVGTHPEAVAWAPDGRHLYVVNGGADTLSVIAAAGYPVTATLPTGKSPNSIAVLPDGTAAYVTNLGDASLTVVDLTS